MFPTVFLMMSIILLIMVMTGVTFYLTSNETRKGMLASILKSREARIATMSLLRQVLYKKTLEEAVSSLSSISIGNYIAKRIPEKITYHAIESLIWKAYANDLIDIESLLYGVYERTYKCFIYKYDLHNIKSIIRGLVLRQREITLIPLGNLIRPWEIDKAKGIKSLNELIDFLEAKEYYHEAKLIEKYEARLEAGELEALSLLEKELMKSWYEKLLKLASEIGDSAVLSVIGALIDMDYILSVVRLIQSDTEELKSNIIELTYNLTSDVKRRLIEAKDIGEILSALQQTPYRNIIEHIIKEGLYRDPLLLDISLKLLFTKYMLLTLLDDIFNVKPLISYLLLKEVEVHMLMFILKVVALDLPREVYEHILHLYPYEC